MTDPANDRERKHQELLSSLAMPADDGRGHYTERCLQAQWVQSRQPSDDGSGVITGTSGWSAHCSPQVFALLPEGTPFAIETTNFSTVTGWLIEGRWYDRKTDEDLDAEHAAWLESWQQEKRDLLARNRDDWQTREQLLPDWIRIRLHGFRDKGGERFDLEGWGYELAVAELAVAYADLGEVILDHTPSTIRQIESDTIEHLAREQGTSGNQHAVALMLAQHHLRGESLAGTISALSPITGDPFYQGGVIPAALAAEGEDQ